MRGMVHFHECQHVSNILVEKIPFRHGDGARPLILENVLAKGPGKIRASEKKRAYRVHILVFWGRGL
jgi:hypothetical protein